MKSNTSKIILTSILVGSYVAFHSKYFSGISSLINIIFTLLILTLLIFSIILVFKEKNRKLKRIQFGFLIACVGIGLLCSSITENNESENRPRTYLDEEVQ